MSSLPLSTSAANFRQRLDKNVADNNSIRTNCHNTATSSHPTGFNPLSLSKSRKSQDQSYTTFYCTSPLFTLRDGTRGFGSPMTTSNSGNNGKLCQSRRVRESNKENVSPFLTEKQGDKTPQCSSAVTKSKKDLHAKKCNILRSSAIQSQCKKLKINNEPKGGSNRSPNKRNVSNATCQSEFRSVEPAERINSETFLNPCDSNIDHSHILFANDSPDAGALCQRALNGNTTRTVRRMIAAPESYRGCHGDVEREETEIPLDSVVVDTREEFREIMSKKQSKNCYADGISRKQRVMKPCVILQKLDQSQVPKRQQQLQQQQQEIFTPEQQKQQQQLLPVNQERRLLKNMKPQRSRSICLEYGIPEHPYQHKEQLEICTITQLGFKTDEETTLWGTRSPDVLTPLSRTQHSESFLGPRPATIGKESTILYVESRQEMSPLTRLLLMKTEKYNETYSPDGRSRVSQWNLDRKYFYQHSPDDTSHARHNCFNSCSAQSNCLNHSGVNLLRRKLIDNAVKALLFSDESACDGMSDQRNKGNKSTQLKTIQLSSYSPDVVDENISEEILQNLVNYTEIENSDTPLGDISKIARTSWHEHASSGDLSGAFHSTFCYPLHSTMNQSILLSDSINQTCQAAESPRAASSENREEEYPSRDHLDDVPVRDCAKDVSLVVNPFYAHRSQVNSCVERIQRSTGCEPMDVDDENIICMENNNSMNGSNFIDHYPNKVVKEAETCSCCTDPAVVREKAENIFQLNRYVEISECNFRNGGSARKYILNKVPVQKNSFITHMHIDHVGTRCRDDSSCHFCELQNSMRSNYVTLIKPKCEYSLDTTLPIQLASDPLPIKSATPCAVQSYKTKARQATQAADALKASLVLSPLGGRISEISSEVRDFPNLLSCRHSDVEEKYQSNIKQRSNNKDPCNKTKLRRQHGISDLEGTLKDLGSSGLVSRNMEYIESELSTVPVTFSADNSQTSYLISGHSLHRYLRCANRSMVDVEQADIYSLNCSDILSGIRLGWLNRNYSERPHCNVIEISYPETLEKESKVMVDSRQDDLSGEPTCSRCELSCVSSQCRGQCCQNTGVKFRSASELSYEENVECCAELYTSWSCQNFCVDCLCNSKTLKCSENFDLLNKQFSSQIYSHSKYEIKTDASVARRLCRGADSMASERKDSRRRRRIVVQKLKIIGLYLQNQHNRVNNQCQQQHQRLHEQQQYHNAPNLSLSVDNFRCSKKQQPEKQHLSHEQQRAQHSLKPQLIAKTQQHKHHRQRLQHHNCLCTTQNDTEQQLQQQINPQQHPMKQFNMQFKSLANEKCRKKFSRLSNEENFYSPYRSRLRHLRERQQEQQTTAEQLIKQNTRQPQLLSQQQSQQQPQKQQQVLQTNRRRKREQQQQQQQNCEQEQRRAETELWRCVQQQQYQNVQQLEENMQQKRLKQVKQQTDECECCAHVQRCRASRNRCKRKTGTRRVKGQPSSARPLSTKSIELKTLAVL